MQFLSTRNLQHHVNLSTAIKTGLAPDGGLYIPEVLPKIDWLQFDAQLSFAAFAQKVLTPFFEGDVLYSKLASIIQETFSFDIPMYALRQVALRSVLNNLE